MPRKKLTEEQRASKTRLNSLKHGFAARSPVIPGIENEADWKRHLKEMRKALAPEGYFEDLLVRRIATALWEIDRLTAHQVATTMANIRQRLEAMVAARAYLTRGEDVELDPYEVQERVQTTLLPAASDLEVIMRHGGQLHRQWIQIYNQLLNIQARRLGHDAPVNMLDVIGPPPNYGPFRTDTPIAKEARDITKLVNARVDRATAQPNA